MTEHEGQKSAVVARCVQCDSEFTEEQIQGAKGCPVCGTTSVPLDPAEDVTIKINTHELRVLTIWADNYARRECQPQAQKSLSCILQRLRAQLPGVTFTLGDEVRDIQASGIDAELIDAGKVVVPSKGKPS